MPRLYREAPVNSVWEGSANVIALDVRRVMGRSPEAIEQLRAELARAKGGNGAFDAFLANLEGELAGATTAEEGLARRLVGRIALGLQAALLIRHAPAALADAFCATRLESGAPAALGTLPAGIDCRAIIDRAAIS